MQKPQQETSKWHSMFSHKYPNRSKNFKTVDSLNLSISLVSQLQDWNKWDIHQNKATQPPKEMLQTWTDLHEKDRVSLNIALVSVGKTIGTLHKWILTTKVECPCGHPFQIINHVLSECPKVPTAETKSKGMQNKNQGLDYPLLHQDMMISRKNISN